MTYDRWRKFPGLQGSMCFSCAPIGYPPEGIPLFNPRGLRGKTDDGLSFAQLEPPLLNVKRGGSRHRPYKDIAPNSDPSLSRQILP